jgi:queuine/archaeosine tRNA-ribosyltransferase
MLDELKARLTELETAEAQAIHNLGVVNGRMQEIRDLIAKLEAEPPRKTVEHGGTKTETTLKAVETEKR